MTSAILCVTVVLLAGCVSVNQSVLSRSRIGQPLPAEQVRVYLDSDSVPPHERIAILHADGESNWTDDAQLIEKLREAAGKLGANAIILGPPKDASTGALIAQVLIGTPAPRKRQAIAVYVPRFDER